MGVFHKLKYLTGNDYVQGGYLGALIVNPTWLPSISQLNQYASLLLTIVGIIGGILLIVNRIRDLNRKTKEYEKND